MITKIKVYMFFVILSIWPTLIPPILLNGNWNDKKRRDKSSKWAIYFLYPTGKMVRRQKNESKHQNELLRPPNKVCACFISVEKKLDRRPPPKNVPLIFKFTPGELSEKYTTTVTVYRIPPSKNRLKVFTKITLKCRD